jgi:quinol-cytochrome oxidoreductase complex cytochrome b subunit
MLTITTPWFDVAVVMSIFAFGNILFGHFERHRPTWKRLLKVVIVTAVTVAIANTIGRVYAYSVLALPLIAAAYVHLVWLPKHGINGWTAEPYDKYLELMRSRGHV